MNKRRKFGWPELILLLVPALALACWGVWLQNRGPFNNPRPFKLVIDEVKVTTSSKGPFVEQEPNTKGVKVVVFIGHEGPAPSWWGTGGVGPSCRVHLTGKGEKDDRYTNIGSYTGFDYDKSRGEYTVVYEGRIPKNPNFLKQATCHVFVELGMWGGPVKTFAAARASIPVHQLG